MTNNNQVITLPDELVQKWANEYWFPSSTCVSNSERYIAIQAAHWGYEQRGVVNKHELQKARDEELEACCEWLLNSAVDGAKTPEPYIVAGPETFINALRAARRPKPPSLKEQALEALNEADQGLNESEWRPRSNTIRRALEQLDD